ncbi:MAG: DUF1684 domain-containing protein [Chitinophagaceae bacterium]
MTGAIKIWLLTTILSNGFFLYLPGAAQTSSAYTNEIKTWDAQRVKELKSDNGWLNLAGLYWLEPGKNSFGTGKQNKLVFPKNSIDEMAGYFEWRDGNVALVSTTREPILVNGKPVKESVIFYQDSAASTQPVVVYKNLKWSVIRREDKTGIRLRDLASPAIVAFKGIERFKMDTKWRIKAILQKPLLQQMIAITNVLGQTTQQPSPGKLLFTINKKRYSLDVLEEGDELFIIFGDATSGLSTYPAGRFLYVQKPGPDGITIIDFNKAHNPPCAFTPFATCPLPPEQNRLPISVTAGEKNYGNH